MNNPSLCFRVIDGHAPRPLTGWRVVREREIWERHYLIGREHSLCLSQARNVFLTAHGTHDDFRTETLMLDAAFPLDWMALNVIERALPRRLRSLEIYGTDAQSFVDSLAVPELVQASVHRRSRLQVLGATTMDVSTLTVPQWNVSATATTFESRNAHALRAIVASAGYGARQHEDLRDWLQRTSAAQTPPPAARQRVGFAS
ncbi:hypothetical protein RDV64_02300 [Acuticoccus sp. MNP-M23]|uniref:hypothetical protein n=1 Tax=Acuticoccus sp. MNP-M23 TaxID=3072793 RepID=UPI00281586EC|nr:hypothetical protein [Acuticoccus sp. MNP-M23]WMS43255.1 hypothetical protein RDV64_02300 [Acuticoccus sp. MNP-M23]